MKVFKMIELLQGMPQDLEVYSYCDHGQTPESSCAPRAVVIVKSEYDHGSIDGYMEKEDAIDSGYEESDLIEIVLL